MAGLLVLVLGHRWACCKTRQFLLLNSTRTYQDDYMIWSLFQFEVESLRLRLAAGAGACASIAADRGGPRSSGAALRDLRQPPRPDRGRACHRWSCASHPDYQKTLDRSKRLRRLGRRPALECSDWVTPANRARAALARSLRRGAAPRLQAPCPVTRCSELSLTASHHVAKPRWTSGTGWCASSRRMSLWLTGLQCALSLGLAALVLRQFRRLNQLRPATSMPWPSACRAPSAKPRQAVAPKASFWPI